MLGYLLQRTNSIKDSCAPPFWQTFADARKRFVVHTCAWGAEAPTTNQPQLKRNTPLKIDVAWMELCPPQG